jgi:hypothetical protein
MTGGGGGGAVLAARRTCVLLRVVKTISASDRNDASMACSACRKRRRHRREGWRATTEQKLRCAAAATAPAHGGALQRVRLALEQEAPIDAKTPGGRAGPQHVRRRHLAFRGHLTSCWCQPPPPAEEPPPRRHLHMRRHRQQPRLHPPPAAETLAPRWPPPTASTRSRAPPPAAPAPGGTAQLPGHGPPASAVPQRGGGSGVVGWACGCAGGRERALGKGIKGGRGWRLLQHPLPHHPGLIEKG